jgi:hypothetical protein
MCVFRLSNVLQYYDTNDNNVVAAAAAVAEKIISF